MRLDSRVPNHLELRNHLPRIESNPKLSRRLLTNQMLIQMLGIYRINKQQKAQAQEDSWKKNK